MATHLLISGRVQGVGYRYNMCVEAQRLGVAGWVRNRADGSVEAFIEGPPALMTALVVWAKRGPPGARVDKVETSAAQDTGALDFVQKNTV